MSADREAHRAPERLRLRGVAFLSRLHECQSRLRIFERCLSTYWAYWWKLRKGGYPFGGRLLTRGIGRDWRVGARIRR